MNAPTPIAIAVVCDGTRVLVGQRPPDVALAGYWEFPGGKIEADELPAQAAVRECREETGIVVRVLTEYPSCVHRYAHGAVQLHFFRCAPIDEQTPLAPYQWIEVDRLDDYRFPEANAEVLRLLKEGA